MIIVDLILLSAFGTFILLFGKNAFSIIKNSLDVYSSKISETFHKNEYDTNVLQEKLFYLKNEIDLKEKILFLKEFQKSQIDKINLEFNSKSAEYKKSASSKIDMCKLIKSNDDISMINMVKTKLKQENIDVDTIMIKFANISKNSHNTLSK
jgi:hypothetical protein